MGVAGIGGIFLKQNDSKRMRDWYTEVLGMTTNGYGVLFEFNGHTSPTKGYLKLGTFEADTDYFGDKSQQAMLNLRVDNLASFQAELIAAGVTITDEIESYSYEKSLHIKGQRIELYEAVDAEFEGSPENTISMR
jgi:catechol 2,3-dioxygenase-like lactoylglutathione lyase family enzyme